MLYKTRFPETWFCFPPLLTFRTLIRILGLMADSSSDPKIKKQIVTKTAIFKLHNPSRRKTIILDTALESYTNGYRELLELASTQLDQLVANASYQDKSGKTRTSARGLAGKLLKLDCTNFAMLSSVLRESICQDVAGNLLSYIALIATDDKTQYPQGRSLDSQDVYLQTLEGLLTGEITIDSKQDYDLWRDNLTRTAHPKPQPIYFCRVRDFNLMPIDENKWGIEIKLLPKDNRFGVTKLRFPIAFGEWHKSFLNQGTPRAAHLVKRDDEYFLHVAFEFVVEIQPTENLLGIDRGVLKQIAFAVTDRAGNLIAFTSGGREVRAMQLERGKNVQADQKKGRRISHRIYRQKMIDERIHILANQIVAEAKKYNAQVVMEDLNVRTAGKFTRSNFAKLLSFLSYKLPLAGLPAPREVFAAYSSQICHKCGNMGTRDEDNREIFRCPSCGLVMDADENAAVNIARRILYRKSEWETRGGYRAFHQSFSQ
jgi:IS605 OrfB family transposase